MKRSFLPALTLTVLAFSFLLTAGGSLQAADQPRGGVVQPLTSRVNDLPPGVVIQPPAAGTGQGASLVVPATINYQGKLTNTLGAPITVMTTLEFRIYDGPGGGALLLWGPQSTPVTPDADGFYNVPLGTGPAFPADLFDGIPRYLGVKVTTEALEMTPRQEITSVAYAINADRLGGLTSGDYVKRAGDVMYGTLGLDFSFSGNVIALTPNGLGNGRADFVNGAGAGNISATLDGGCLACPVGGSLNLNKESGTPGASLYGGTTGSGGTLNLTNGASATTITLDGGVAGNASAVLPANAISAIELGPDAKAAAGSVLLPAPLTVSPVPATLTSFTVTVPAAGVLWLNVSGQWWYDADAVGVASLTVSFDMGLCTTPASSATCGGTYIDRYYQDADATSGFNSTHGFSLVRVVPVGGPGAVTFYLNADNAGSGFAIHLYPGAIASALYVPVALPVATPGPETPQIGQPRE